MRENEVHFWSASLDQPSAHVEALWRILSHEEKERVERFRFQKDRESFVLARGFLREILGGYLGVDPASLSFVYNSSGKPLLPKDFGDLRFNLSHSHGLAVCAMVRGREIGVDVERIRSDLNWEGVARRFFSDSENEALRSLPEKDRPEAFFNGWTRKEAFMKAKGEGFSIPLRAFDVSLGDPARILTARWDPEEASRWSLHSFRPAPGYVAAVAVEGGDEVRLKDGFLFSKNAAIPS